MLFNTGTTKAISHKGLLTTIACNATGQPVYALEGAVFIAGAVVQWLRDELKIIPDSQSTEKIIQGLKDTGGVYFVPAFAGLGAPYWDPHVRGAITGLTRGSSRPQIVRAAIESMAYQTKDIFDVMAQEAKLKIRHLSVDGGACRNNFLMQFQADMLRVPVVRPKMVDTTVAGAAHLAGVTSGLWKPSQLQAMRGTDRIFKPQLAIKESQSKYQAWQKAVQHLLG